EWQARNHEDAECREPARTWRHADPYRRRMGACLLHRLPQRAAEIPGGLRRSPDQLGLCRGKAAKSRVTPKAMGWALPSPNMARAAAPPLRHYPGKRLAKALSGD